MSSDSTDDQATYTSSPLLAHTAQSGGALLKPRQTFGPYTIHRLLGRGGMGEVYEAEHAEHGRRVAIKILAQQLAGAEDRARFLREGQLAASLNHPNSVYIFGSEVVAGTPVIVMELVAGGTLKDAVDRDGPMAPGAAVDAILHIVAGLEAAHARGILHRDVKPSNCFVNLDGGVKIGDFGLSIPAVAPDETQRAEPSSFQGTPQYAAPEQLRGETLDARADIYAVGGTLYYLLTGHAPFEDRELMALVTRIATEAPAPLRAAGSKIPAGLSAVVLRCLAKKREDRPASYAALAAELQPFNSAAPSPARPGLRLMAGVIDVLLLKAVIAPLTFSPVINLSSPGSITGTVLYSSPGGRATPAWISAAAFAVTLAYFALLEGCGGRSVGKRICGLAVTTPSGEPAGFARAALRALVFVTPDLVPLLGLMAAALAGPASALSAAGWAGRAMSSAVSPLFVLMFSTVRRRNGFAGLHELASGTRVVTRPRPAARAVMPTALAPLMPAQTAVINLGPFQVMGGLAATDAGRLMLGLDPTLARQVWLRVLEPETPGLARVLCDMGRPGRLRWLNGRRTDTECWDAYEAPDGAALLSVTADAQPWSVVKPWLLDLSSELEQAAADGTVPTLSLDRVWITRNSSARLLDFAAPGVPSGADGSGAREAFTSPQRFLYAVAARALGLAAAPATADVSPAGPLPIPAHAMLDTLARDGFPSPQAVASSARMIAAGHDRVTRASRVASIVLAIVPLLVASVGLLVIAPTAFRLMRPGNEAVLKALVRLHELEGRTDQEAGRRRRALEVFLADEFRTTVDQETLWRDRALKPLMAPLRPLAARALAAHPSVSDAERAAAMSELQPVLTGGANLRQLVGNIVTILPSVVLLASAVAAVLSACLFKGGLLLRLLGIGVAGGRGGQATRLRASCRALVAWSPVFALWGWVAIWRLAGRDMGEILTGTWVLPATALALVLGSAWAIRHPSRGPAERITGTWLVPR